MALFDFIREMNSPDIVSRFNKLYDEHYEGLKAHYSVLYGLNHEPFSKDICFAAKKALVEKEQEIIFEDRRIHSLKTLGKIRTKVEPYIVSFPHAYVHYSLILGLSIESLLEEITMPGSKKYETIDSDTNKYSRWGTQKLYKCVDRNFEELVLSKIDFYRKKLSERTLFTLKDKYASLLPYIEQFEDKEKEIIDIINNEELWHVVDEEILAKPHCVYLKEYLIHKFGTEKCSLTDYEYIARNIGDFYLYVMKFKQEFKDGKKDNFSSLSSEEFSRRSSNLFILKRFEKRIWCSSLDDKLKSLEGVLSYRSVLIECEEAMRKEIQRQQERDDKKRIRKAEELLNRCHSAAAERGFSIHDITRDIADQILAMKDELIVSQILSFESDCWFKHEEKINDIPHKYFFKYYPLSASAPVNGDREHRQLIWDFKDAKRQAQEIVLSNVVDYLKGLNIDEFFDKITFVCAPASSRESYKNRFALFSKRVCEECGMRDGTPHISILNSVTPKHLGGEESVKYEVDRNYFKGQWIIVFDDLVTSGFTISRFTSRLSEVGAKVIGIITIGRTV